MPYLLGGVLALVLLLWLLGKFTKGNPAQMADAIKTAGGLGALVVAGVMALTGRWAAAGPIAAVGLSVLARKMFAGASAGASAGARTQRKPGSRSKVNSAWLEMELDHDNGSLTGKVVRGSRKGASLNDLAVADIVALFSEVDAESVQLLEAYLDRRAPRWREDVKGDGSARRGKGHAGTGPMTAQEAYEILGLEPGASARAVRDAHRKLMARVHPDKGGSTYLAAKINAAKDILLDTHNT